MIIADLMDDCAASVGRSSVSVVILGRQSLETIQLINDLTCTNSTRSRIIFFGMIDLLRRIVDSHIDFIPNMLDLFWICETISRA